MKMFTRPSLSSVPPAVHGARDYSELAELRLDPDDIIDFSSNKNPYGPHPDVLRAVAAAVKPSTLKRYPDRACTDLSQALRASEDVPAKSLLPTNGASELIQLVSLAFVASGSRHLILAPTFGEYARAIHLMGGLVYEQRPAEPGLLLDIDDVSSAIRALRPDGIWLCNPNNPTGQLWRNDELDYLRKADPDERTLWVVDESYRHFSKELPESTNFRRLEYPNTVVVRSLTKEHGLAGLRLGYCVAAPEIIEVLRRAQPPWSVNSLAQIAGIAALQPEVLAWRDKSLTLLHQHAANLWSQLQAMGLSVVSSSTPFALLDVGNAVRARRALLLKKLLVRDCASFGLPAYIRISAQLPEENERLLDGMRQLAQNGFASDSVTESQLS